MTTFSEEQRQVLEEIASVFGQTRLQLEDIICKLAEAYPNDATPSGEPDNAEEHRWQH